MLSDTETLTRPDGFPIHVHLWWPEDGAPRGLLHINHGVAEHGARYARFAEALTGAGWAVVAQDHRGHGLSVRDEGDRGHYADHDGWTVAREDAVAVSEWARARFPEGAFVLFGHSGGSHLATHLLATHAGIWDAAILSGPAGVVGPMRVAGRGIAALERLRLGRRGRSRLLHFLSFGDFNRAFEPARTEYDWLSRDPDEVDKYANDPLCGFIVTTQHWFDHLGALALLGDTKGLSHIPHALPLRVIAGSMDPVGGATKQILPFLDNLQAAGLTNVSHRFYTDARHELLNETNRAEVMADLMAWLDDVAPA